MPIEIDERVFATTGHHQAFESILLEGDVDIDRGRAALARASSRFMTTDELGVEHAPDWQPDGQLHSPSYVSDPVVTELGLHLSIDAKGHIPPEMRARLLRILIEELERAGALDVRIVVPVDPSDDPRDGLDGLAVSLWCYSAPGDLLLDERVPTTWLADAATWLRKECGGSAALDVRGVVSWMATVDEAERILTSIQRERTIGFMTAERRFAMVSGATLQLAAAALSIDDAERAAETMIGVGRALQPAPIYAFVAIDGFMPRGFTGWRPDFRRQRINQGAVRCDRHIVDAFPWQRLSPAHVASLPGGDDLVDLGSVGGAELRVGTVRAWWRSYPPHR